MNGLYKFVGLTYCQARPSFYLGTDVQCLKSDYIQLSLNESLSVINNLCNGT